MRPPRCVDDATMLLEEPFISAFCGSTSDLPNLEVQHLIRGICAKIQAARGGPEAVNSWFELAFESDPQDKRRFPTRTNRDYRITIAFVKFFWCLFCQQDITKLLQSIKLPGYRPKRLHEPPPEEPRSEQISLLSEISDSENKPTEEARPLRAAATDALMTHPSSESVAKPKSSGIDLRSARSIGVPRPPAHPTSHRERKKPPLQQRPACSADAGMQPISPTESPSDNAASSSLPCEAFGSSPPVNSEYFPMHTNVEATPPSVDSVATPPAGDLDALAMPPSTHQEDFISQPTNAVSLPRNSPGFAEDIIMRLAEPTLGSTTRVLSAQAVMQAHAADALLALAAQSYDSARPSKSSTEFRTIKPEPVDDQDAMMVLLEPSDTPENWLLATPNDEQGLIPNAKEEEPEEIIVEAESPPKLPKTALRGYPPLWAESRQEVCEAFEWFRSYQGGVYQNDGAVKGYFLSGHPANRDKFYHDGKIIISHGGGKAGSASSQGRADNQSAQDISVRALLKNYRQSRPLVLLVDDKYELFPVDLASRNIYMAVLGFYRIIHVWAEFVYLNTGRVVRYKFAFQWCEDQGEPWWIENTAEGTTADTNSNSIPSPKPIEPTLTDLSPIRPPHLYNTCALCAEPSPRVYTCGWACLSPRCAAFWTLNVNDNDRDKALLPAQLEYDPAFLTLIDFRPLPPAFKDALLPRPPVPAPANGNTTTYAYSRGWHCRKCGRLACRSAWEHYQCPNCKDTLPIKSVIRPAKDLKALAVPTNFTDSFVDDPVIVRHPMKIYNHFGSDGATGQSQTFVLPEGKGKIHLIKAHRLRNLEADGIFSDYQRQAADGTLAFRRWPLRMHKLRGQLLTNYFSQNSGETYHYVGGTDNTVPFDRAPAAVVRARDLIERRIREALGLEYHFNEVLSAAYMEQQKMAFHSDSERGLGPVVAGLSMGSPALMHFRVLSKNKAQHREPTAMTVVLRHGDVLVMEGAGVQDFYEHTVVPCNFRIAATARWIEPQHHA